MKEKQNQPFFSREREISTLLIHAVKNNLLTPYVNDSLTTPMTKLDFLENLKYADEGGGLTEEEKALGFGEEDDEDWGSVSTGETTVAAPAADEYPSRDFSVIEIKEDYFFDKIRSRMYYDILGITLILPADKNPAGFEKLLAAFRFIDLAKYFKSVPDRAIWFNAKNHARHLNMTDAFLLRLFDGTIVKIANPSDDRLVDVYATSRKKAALAAQQAEYQLVDFEAQLWEY